MTKRVFVSLAAATMLVILASLTASAASGDVTVTVDGETKTVKEGDIIATVPPEGDGQASEDGPPQCGKLPKFKVELTGNVKLFEARLKGEDCTLRVTKIKRGKAVPKEAEESDDSEPPVFGQQGSAYYRFYLQTSATTRGFAYVEALNRTRTNIQVWAPSMRESGPLAAAHNAWHDCSAWGSPTNFWRVTSCSSAGESLNSTRSVWKKARGAFKWDPPGTFLDRNQRTWSKSEIKGYTRGSSRFRSTCGTAGGFIDDRPRINYFRCERKWGPLS